jgi:hypothetical protein
MKQNVKTIWSTYCYEFYYCAAIRSHFSLEEYSLQGCNTVVYREVNVLEEHPFMGQ